ncbi:MAG: ABC transporter substrate-binding protein [Actinomycetota bacterium]
MKPHRAWLAAFALLVSSCRAGTPGAASDTPRPDRPDVIIALVGATSGRSASSAIHALDGARLAFDEANEQGYLAVDVIAETFNTLEDQERAEEIGRETAADPEVVGMIAWPSTGEADALLKPLEGSGLPVILLSPAVTSVGEGAVRIVGDDVEQARAVALDLSRRRGPICLAGDDGARSVAMRRYVADGLRKRGVDVGANEEVSAESPVFEPLIESLADRNCRVVFWSGGGTEAAEVRLGISQAGLAGSRLVGIDAMKSDAYLSLTAGEGYGTLAWCPCVDLSTGERVKDQRFVQEYQAKYGGSPGPFAAEGWDAAQLFLSEMRSGQLERATLASAIAGTKRFHGLAGEYELTSDGELAAEKERVLLYEDRNGQWVAWER